MPARSRRQQTAEATNARRDAHVAGEQEKRGRREKIEYKVVSVTLTGDKAAIIARLLNISFPERQSR